MSSTATLSFDATITERGQTTVPSAIRKMLGVNKGVITFKGMPDGTVIIEPKTDEASDPALQGFLRLLEKDITINPAQLAAMTQELLDESKGLVEGVEVDMDAPLSDD